MKTLYLFSFILLLNASLNAQNAVSFDSLQFQFSFLTDDAVYFNSDKLVKADYNGNIIWSKSGGITNRIFKVKDNGVYIFNATNLTKIDTAGNLLWSKDFIQPVCSMASVPSSIADVVINHDRIFILSNQTQPSSIDYPSLITLDTSGNILNSWCGDDYHNCTFQMGKERISGGAWIAGDDGGSIHAGISIMVDNNGNLTPNININTFQRGQFSFIRAILTKNNSYHCYLVNSFTPGFYAYPYLIFESDIGNRVTYKGYTMPGSSYGLECIQAAIDHNDNLFILAHASVGTVLFKTNSTGTVLISKGWSPAAENSYQLNFARYNLNEKSMIYRNDSLYIACTIDGKPSIITFDPFLSTSCFTPDLVMQIDDFPNISVGGFNSFPVLSVALNNTDTLFQIQNSFVPHSFSLCRTTTLNEIEINSKVEVYPNPADDELYINTKGEQFEFSVFSTTGQLVEVPFEKTEDAIKLNTSDINNGIYILIIKIGEGILKKMIQVNH